MFQVSEKQSGRWCGFGGEGQPGPSRALKEDGDLMRGLLLLCPGADIAQGAPSLPQMEAVIPTGLDAQTLAGGNLVVSAPGWDARAAKGQWQKAAVREVPFGMTAVGTQSFGWLWQPSSAGSVSLWGHGEGKAGKRDARNCSAGFALCFGGQLLCRRCSFHMNLCLGSEKV